LWPTKIAEVVSKGYDQQVREGWQFIPETFDRLCDWAAVVSDESVGKHVGLRHLVYDAAVMKDDDGGLCTVTIVLQGFLGKCALSALGNWKGSVYRDAPSAVQFMELESGGCDVPFGAQQRALKDIRELIALKVGGAVLDGGNSDDPVITLRRRVFTKVRPTDNGVTGVRLTDANDPNGFARKVAHHWRVEGSISTAIRRPNGSNMAVAYDVLQPGDFVEVSATAYVEVVRTRKRRGTVIQFEMHEVVRLL
ncbi:hypothetical protein GY45DRAFT_1235425, partial [Cubamyces sp. BRFM 1775]